MKPKVRSKIPKHAAEPSVRRRSHEIPILQAEYDADALDQPFAGGVADQLDPDLRHRLVSEAAFHHQAERGYNSDYEDDDWRDAEGEVGHVVLNR